MVVVNGSPSSERTANSADHRSRYRA